MRLPVAIPALPHDDKILGHNRCHQTENPRADRYRAKTGGQRQENSQDGQGRILSVSDQGLGINTEARQHLFEPGISRSVRGWPQGTGLGLYESRRLTRLLGWEIVAPEQTKGATFEIRIPGNWRKDYAQ